MKLSIYYSYLLRFDPDIANPEIEAYCTQSDLPPSSVSGLPSSVPEREAVEGRFHFGHKSLKWAMYQIDEIDPKRAKHVFKAIMIEHKAREKSILDIQYNILNYAALAEYKQIIRSRTKGTIDIETIGHFTAGDFIFAINETTENLTARIFRDTNADAILFRNPETLSAGIIFRSNLRTFHSGLPTSDLFKHISESEPGWKASAINPEGDGGSIINHGAPSNTATTHTIETLKQIICKYLD
jgi:hypothetical protein